MKRIVTTALLAGAFWVLPNPTPAGAETLQNCVDEAVASCDDEFGGDNFRTISVRGWCYMIRTGLCKVFD